MKEKVLKYTSCISESFELRGTEPEESHSRERLPVSGNMIKNAQVLSLGLIMVTLLFSGVFMQTTEAASSDDHPTAYLVLVDKLSINDIDAVTTPEIYRLVHEGAIGLASNRTLRGRNTIDSSLTIGAGNLGRGYTNGIMAFNKSEMVPHRNQTASQYYENLTGWDGSSSACLLVNLPEIISGMTKEHVKTVPGALGESLRLNNYKVCVLGNGDNGLEMSRAGVVVAMDASGRVPMGDVGSATYQKAPESFLAYDTNYVYLEEQIEYYRSQADLIVLELSDLARLETCDTAFNQVAEREKELRLQRIDQMIGMLGQMIDPQQDLLLLVGVSPAKVMTDLKDNFTPVLAYGKGFPPGMLSSATSRRDYVVANTDVAPTILKAFGLEDEQRVMIGQVMVSKPLPAGDSLQQACDLGVATSTVNRLRTPLIKGYVILQIIIILLSLVVIFWIRHGARIFRPLLVSMVVVPLVLLVLTKVQLGYDWLYILLAIIATAVVTAVVLYIFKNDGFKGFVFISFLTLIAINLDLLTGTSFIQNSVLGYDPMSGARYYGIGNEYMGILIGSSIAVATALYQKYKNRRVMLLLAVMFLLECYFIAGPTLGANSDGILTAPAAFLVTLLLLQGIKIRPRVILAGIGIIALLVAGLTYYDMSRPLELQTHIGRAANQIAAGGWQEMLQIISRKMSMNLKLIRYTIWSYVFIVILLVISLLVYRPVGAMRQLMLQHPYIVKGFAGIITGAIVGLLINDSGIVAASTTSIYLVVPLLLLMLNVDIDESENKTS